MMLNAWTWILGICTLWVIGAIYFLFFRTAKSKDLIPVLVSPRSDSEVIVSKTKIMINVLFAEEEKIQATPAVLADFVISFKDIINGSYKPAVALLNTETITGNGIINGDIDETPDQKEKEDQTIGLPEDEIPDLSNEPDLPEVDTAEIPDRKNDSDLVLDESQLVDSNTLNLNMLNL